MGRLVAFGPALRRQPALDGLRGVAILLVVLGHLGIGFEASATLGVAVFFTLSGFLITRIMIDDGDLVAFYIRRAGRLLPALVVVLAVMGIVGFLAGDGRYGLRTLSALFYVENWFEAAGFSGELDGQTWSLAVEEQFYLFWPLLLLWALRSGPRRALYVALALGAFSFAERIALYAAGTGWDRVYYGTDVWVGSLMAGAALALAREQGWSWRPTRLTLTLSAVAVAAIGTRALDADLGLLATIGWPLTAAATVTFISAALEGGAPILASRWLVVAGIGSYSLYLWHAPILYAARTTFEAVPLVVRAPVALGLSVACAFLSYRLVEAPIRRWSRQVSGRQRRRFDEEQVGDAGPRAAVDDPAAGSGAARLDLERV